MTSKRTVVVDQDPNKPVEKHVLAQAIVDISKAVQALSRSGLNRKAITVLVQHKTHLGHASVDAVLDALDQLAADYTAKR